MAPPAKATKAAKTTKATKATKTSKASTRASVAKATATADASAASLREQRRLRQQDLGRAQLLDAAEEVFGEKGFHDSSLKDIAERAEFSVGSVYSFFENKDDLFMSVFLRRGDELVPAIRHAVSDAAASPLEQLHRLIDVEVGFFRDHPRFGRLYLRTSSATALSPERPVDEAMRTRFSEAMALQASLFERGQRAGVFRSGDPAVLARLFSGLVSAFQASDPLVLGEDAAGTCGAGLELAAFHEVVERAFRA